MFLFLSFRCLEKSVLGFSTYSFFIFTFFSFHALDENQRCVIWLPRSGALLDLDNLCGPVHASQAELMAQ